MLFKRLLGLVLLALFAFPQMIMSAELGNIVPNRHFVVKSKFVELDMPGQKEQRAWLEYPENRFKYILELEKGIVNLKLIELSHQGQYASVVNRMDNIREHLENAIDILLSSEKPRISLRPIHEYKDQVGIYAAPAWSNYLDFYPIRIMTVHKEDARNFAMLDDANFPAKRKPFYLASYIAAQIEAHFYLFIKNDENYDIYEEIAMDNTVEGKIYREVFIRAMDVVTIAEKDFERDIISDALQRFDLYQRSRLQERSYIVPRRWNENPVGKLVK